RIRRENTSAGEGDVAKPSRGPHVRQVRAPPLVRAPGQIPVAFDVVRVTRDFTRGRGGGAGAFTASNPRDSGDLHQPFHLVPTDLQPGPQGLPSTVSGARTGADS